MKRFLSAALCVCLILALAVPVGASTPHFSDAAQIDNWEQVCMLYDLGLISGYAGGTFDPDGYITRAEAAKIVAIILDPDAGSAGESEFTDMAGHWASSYVRYCTDLGLFSGYDDGSFLPDRNITARELTKILLIAVGCDGSKYTGSNWAAAVDSDAEELGLYDGFQGRLDMDVTRDNACLLIFNALNCYAVEEDENGQRTYVTDQLMNPVTVLENRFGVVRYEQYIEANEYVDLTDPDHYLEEGLTKIHGHREFAVSTDLSMIGHWMGICVVGNTVVGVPYYSANEVTATFSSLEEMEAALAEAQYDTDKDTLYYLNYTACDASDLESLGEMAEITVIDHEGDHTVDIVLAVDYQPATVLDGRDLTIALNSDLAAAEAAGDSESGDAAGSGEAAETPTGEAVSTEQAESERASDSSEETDAVQSDDSEEDAEMEALTPAVPLITDDQLITDVGRLQNGEQVWVARVGNRYLIKTVE